MTDTMLSSVRTPRPRLSRLTVSNCSGASALAFTPARTHIYAHIMRITGIVCWVV